MQRGLARWARLGDLNIASTADEARPENYRIIEHILHPEYEPPAQYNDIGLFLLEKDVEFSKFIRPICLNSDPLINPTVQIATGWGQIYTGKFILIAMWNGFYIFSFYNN